MNPDAQQQQDEDRREQEVARRELGSALEAIVMGADGKAGAVAVERLLDLRLVSLESRIEELTKRMGRMCPVCGFPGLDADRDIEHQICSQCGTHFGYEDCYQTHEELGRTWLERGQPVLWGSWLTPESAFRDGYRAAEARYYPAADDAWKDYASRYAPRPLEESPPLPARAPDPSLRVHPRPEEKEAVEKVQGTVVRRSSSASEDASVISVRFNGELTAHDHFELNDQVVVTAHSSAPVSHPLESEAASPTNRISRRTNAGSQNGAHQGNDRALPGPRNARRRPRLPLASRVDRQASVRQVEEAE